MKQAILFIFIIMVSLCSYGQGVNIISNFDKKYQSISTSQTGGRYEIIQSDRARVLTFKVDKYDGIVYQLVIKEDSTYTWQEIPRYNKIKDQCKPGTINYQVFMGGIMQCDCFLLNIQTGAVWLLYKDNKKNLFFYYME